MPGPTRIICIGNRLEPTDDAGPRVYDRLVAAGLPEGIECVDGGLHGLRLLNILEGAARVVFVDSMVGYGSPGEVRQWAVEEVIALAVGAYSHDAGLPYLLAVAPAVCDGPLPEIAVLAVERGATDAQLDHAAVRALALASAETSRACA